MDLSEKDYALMRVAAEYEKMARGNMVTKRFDAFYEMGYADGIYIVLGHQYGIQDRPHKEMVGLLKEAANGQ